MSSVNDKTISKNLLKNIFILLFTFVLSRSFGKYSLVIARSGVFRVSAVEVEFVVFNCTILSRLSYRV